MIKRRLKSVGLVFDDSLDKTDGVAQYVKNLGSWLTAQGYDVSYLVGQTDIQNFMGGEVYSLSKNMSVRFNGNSLSMPLPSRAANIKKLIAKKHFDVLHVMVPYSPFMAQIIINNVPSTTKIVGTFHIFPSGQAAKLGGKLLRLLYGRSLNKFSRVVSVSPAAQQYAKASFGINSLVIPNMVNTKLFRTNIKYQKNNIVFLGRLVKRKGCEQMILAFARLLKTNPDVFLSIAGDGPQRAELEKLTSKLNISDKVKFLGFIDETDKPGLLASAHIACFPSLYGESFGIVLIEAMAAGSQIVLGGSNPGYASVLGVKPELLVDPKNSEGFAESMASLLKEDEHSSELHAWQAQEVKKYDIDVVGHQIEQLYTESIAR